MARKKSNGRIMKRRKAEPAVKTLSFYFTVPAGGQTESTIDLSQCASLVNRRFYRQGLNWAVAGMKVLTSSAEQPKAIISVQKLPDTWVMSNSWHKGFAAWQRMNNEALEEAESVKPRFLDFKIYADSIHHQGGFAGNLLPLSSLGAFTAGEWESSKYVIPQPGGATNSREVVAVGASYPGAGASGLDAVSLIEGYAASRGLPPITDPNTPDDAGDVTGPTAENWIAGIFDEGTTQDDRVLDDMITENNLSPYPFENDGVNVDTMYPNGANQGTGLQIHDNEYITGTTVGGRTIIKGGSFPCGLIRLLTTNQTVDSNDDPVLINVALQVELVPGPHRGYLCQPMQEM